MTEKPKLIPLKAMAQAGSVLKRKKCAKTPLEDALAADGGRRAAQLVEWARADWNNCRSGLTTWRTNRRKWAQEAMDVFKHRERPGSRYEDGRPAVFETQNDSLNVIGALAEFAAAQAEQDVFGGEPWFAAQPVGRHDPALAEMIQKHLQWTFRDGRKVQTYCSGIARAVALGECFVKTCYHVETDSYEERLDVLHEDGKPLRLADGVLVTEDVARKAEQTLPLKGKLDWKPVFRERQVVLSQGVESVILNFEDVAFREDAPALDLRYTNFYHLVEMPALEAMRRFHLSKQDGLRLAQAANVTATAGSVKEGAGEMHADTLAEDLPEAVFGDEECERLLNSRVRLVEGFVRLDPLGDGVERRLHVVFPPAAEPWLVAADYLANVSPNAELPVKVAVWEEVPERLYGRGFFAKYEGVQKQVDDLWNQVGFRNRMHANPITGVHPDKMEQEEEETDLVLRAGMSVRMKNGERLGEAIEFLSFPDLDTRSMELMNVGIQMVQLRSGISSASQGDMSAVPEANTATGIRQLMSRAAVLLKKPIRSLRRAFGRDFSYSVRLFYTNFDREEAFTWGEGRNAQMITMTRDKVANLDIDVRMLLTQEHNHSKLEGATAATNIFTQYIGLPEAEKKSGRPLYLQAIKALEFDNADDIIRQPVLTLEEAAKLLPKDQQQRVEALLKLEAEAGKQKAGGEEGNDDEEEDEQQGQQAPGLLGEAPDAGGPGGAAAALMGMMGQGGQGGQGGQMGPGGMTGEMSPGAPLGAGGGAEGAGMMPAPGQMPDGMMSMPR